MRVQWFTVRLSISNVLELDDPETIVALEEELASRPHLHQPIVESTGRAREVVVQFDMEGTDADSTAKQGAEELLELSVAVFYDPTGLRIRSIGATPRNG